MSRTAWRARLANLLQSGLGAVSVRTKILGIVLALTVLLGLVVTWQVRFVMVGVLGDEVASRGASIASDLAARSVEPILLDNTVGLHDLLVSTVSNHSDSTYAYVSDGDGRVVAHTFGAEGFPSDLVAVTPTSDGVAAFRTDEGIVHDFSQSIMDGRLGFVHVGLTESRLRSVIDTTTSQILLTTVAVSVLGILAAVFLTWLLTRPILDLVDVTRRVGAGDLEARATLWASDEIGVLSSSFNQMVADLEVSRQRLEDNEEARRRLLHQLIDAQEEERRRIARELHDSIGQALNSISLGLRSLVRSVPESEEEVVRLEAITSETLQSARQLSRDLRPAALDDLGLAAALENYIAGFGNRHPSIAADAHIDLPGRLDRAVETAVYRIVQEAVTNVGRHSQARTMSVVVGRRGAHVTAIIEDDGIGFVVDAAQRSGTSVGIHSIRERAELVGGSLRLESGDQGTTVFLEVPA